MRAGTTVSSKTYISLAYAMNVTGLYTVTNLQYHPEIYDTDFMNILLHKNPHWQHFNFLEVEFQKRQWESTSANVQVYLSQNEIPVFNRSYSSLTQEEQLPNRHWQKKSTEQATIISQQLKMTMMTTKLITFHGLVSLMQVIFSRWSQTFCDMKQSLERDVFTYHFNDPRCQPSSVL